MKRNQKGNEVKGEMDCESQNKEERERETRKEGEIEREEELNRKENMKRRAVAVKWRLTFDSYSVFENTDPNV